MATDGKFLSDSPCTASADLSVTSGLAGPNGAGQYLLVKVSGSLTVTVCAANTDIPFGVLQNDPLPGAPANVAFAGVSKVIAGAAITAGAQLMSDSSGRAITQTGSNPIAGMALETAASANQIVKMLIAPSIGAPG